MKVNRLHRTAHKRKPWWGKMKSLWWPFSERLLWKHHYSTNSTLLSTTRPAEVKLRVESACKVHTLTCSHGLPHQVRCPWTNIFLIITQFKGKIGVSQFWNDISGIKIEKWTHQNAQHTRLQQLSTVSLRCPLQTLVWASEQAQVNSQPWL